jgi:hypothetical protein
LWYRVGFMRKDNVDLICNIGELAGLFKKSSSLEDFLQTVVSIVAYHMRVGGVLGLPLRRENQELVLTATQGLSPESIGKVRLKLGEGLTGQALKELRPIREGIRHPQPPVQIHSRHLRGALPGLPGRADHARAGAGGRAGAAGSGGRTTSTRTTPRPCRPSPPSWPPPSKTPSCC